MMNPPAKVLAMPRMITRIFGTAIAVMLGAALLAPDAAHAQQAPPPPLPLEPVSFPAFEERTLSNGARVLVVEHDEQPIVSINMRVGAGAAADPEGLPGVASFTASLLDNGTENRTASEIAQSIDFVGGNLGAGASNDWTSVTARGLTEHMDTVLTLLSDIVLNPTFPEDELETERTRTLSSLEVELSQPAAVASRRFFSEIYGPHPYGAQQTPESVNALSRADLVEFHRQHYRPENTLIVVAGAVDTDEIVARLDEHFAGWEGSAAVSEVAPAPPEPGDRRLVFVHKPGSVQAVIRMGHLLPSAMEADWVTLDVANQVLGGGTTGWLFRILRNEKGYTYGAYSSMTERQGPGFFQATAEVRNEVADSAMDELLRLVERVPAGDIPAEDLENAKNYLTGSFPRSIETPQQVASQLATTLLLGRDVEYLEEYRQRVDAVDIEELRRVTSSHLHPDRSVIVVVGDATQILEPLRPFADRVELYDDRGNELTLEDLAPRASDMTFDPSGLQPGTYVYSMSFQGNPVGEMTNRVTRVTMEGGREAIRSEQSTSTAMGDVEQSVTFDAETFEPIRASMAEGMAGALELEYADGRIVGEVTPPAAAGGGEPREVDVEAPAGTLLPGMDQFAVALADLAVGEVFDLGMVESSSGSVVPSRFEVVADTTIEAEAGTFEVYEVNAAVGSQNLTLYVRQEAPHILIRQEFAGQPVVVELREMPEN